MSLRCQKLLDSSTHFDTLDALFWWENRLCCHVQSFSLRHSEGAKFCTFDSVVI